MPITHVGIYPYTIQRLKPSSVRSVSICRVPLPKFMTDFFFKLFSLDYMGNAVFEYGQVSDAVKTLWTLRRKLRDDILTFKEMKDGKFVSVNTVYILNLPDDDYLARHFIMRKAYNENDQNWPSREAILLEYSLKNPQDENRPIAWLCIDNPPFFFTTDEKLFRKFVKMLKSKHMEEMFK